MNAIGTQALEKRIGFYFEDGKLLDTALTHPSCARESNYERLEFLGDAVLELVISDYLYKKFGDLSEGVLTQKRAEIVCAKSLSAIAREIGLGEFVFLGKGEEQSGGRDKPSILENVIEAVIGAVYLDGGFFSARTVVLQLFEERIGQVVSAVEASDYKSQLQEMVQKTVKKNISYLVSRKEGPPHNTTFYIRLIVGDDVICEGVGSSKKEAEQNAAQFGIENFDKILKL